VRSVARRGNPEQAYFYKLYQKVPVQTRESLLHFRQHYPSRNISSFDQSWEYIVLGKGEKWVIFLHGMMGAYDIWWQQMLVLSQHFKIMSVTYPVVRSLSELASGIIHLMEIEGITKTSLVGSSLGGYLVQYFLAKYPAWLEKVVLGNTFPPNPFIRQKNEKIIRLLPFVPEWLLWRSFRKHIRKIIYPASGYSELTLAYLLEQTYGRTSQAQMISRAGLVIEPFQPVFSRDFTIPVCIIECDNDPLVDSKLRSMLKDAYPQAEVHTISGGGHFPYLSQPKLYTNLLWNFLKE